MTITSLRINDFRNLTNAQLEPVQHGLNIIAGNNGSGKTSLLEAIYFLGHGKSFRSSLASRLIHHEAQKFSVFTKILTKLMRIVPIGIEREHTGSSRLRVDEQDTTSMIELASYLPIRIINTQSHQLLEGGPIFRRKYLDWGLFYHNSEFMMAWRHYERALKQRNAILKERRGKNELEIWTHELVKYGRLLDKMRFDYIAELMPQIQYLTNQLLPQISVTIEYQSGWTSGQDFLTVLQDSIIDDFRAGYTQAGPHRADFDLISDGLSLRHVLSRGQQKLLICAMILAQGKLLISQDKQGLIYLVDDLPSELDLVSRQKLVSLLAQQKSQIFITAIEKESICDLIADKSDVPMKVFHVEHGKINELAEILV